MRPTDSFSAVSSEDRWDAIVIGAGPAGAVAARQMALQGKQVLLVEKSRLPRSKVCGGCLGGAALEALDSIGLGGLPLACGGVPLTTFEFASGGAIACIPVGRRVAVSRQTLDEALVREAARAGVVVCDEVRASLLPFAGGSLRQVTLRHRTHNVTAQASVMIVATGLAQCPVDFTTRVFRGSYIGLGAILEEAPFEASPGVLHMACGSHGYVGITQVERGAFAVAAAVDPHALAVAASPGQLVHRILSQSGLSPAIDLSAIPWSGTPPLTRHATPLGSHRCLLIGDAAGYVEPFTGEGIGWAIHSAVLAASLLSGPLDSWDSGIPARWRRAYDCALAHKQRSCHAMSRALRSQLVRRLVTMGLRRAPSLSRSIVNRLDCPFVTPTS